MKRILRIQGDGFPPPFLLFEMGEVPKAEGVWLRREAEPAADGEIDGLVAVRELYGLTEEEIRIVEG